MTTAAISRTAPRRDRARWPALASLLFGVAAWAGDPNSPVTSALGLELAYDTSVFRVKEGPLADRAAWVATATARVEVKARGGARLRYALEQAEFVGASSEEHARHAATLAWQGALGSANWDVTSTAMWVDGAVESPRFGAGRNCFAISLARERRAQWQYRSAARWTYRRDAGFVRLVGAFTGYDMRTRAQTAPGTDNYVDRHDVAGGLDVGRELGTGVSIALGYRRGYQEQDRDGGRLSDRSNDYHRLPVLIEGKLGPSVKVTLQAGPEWHRYAGDSVGPRSIARWYVDGSVVAAVGAADEVTLTRKQVQTLASTGGVSTQDISTGLAWRHRFDPRWSMTLGWKLQNGIYDGSIRDDVLRTAHAGVDWTPRRGLEIGVHLNVEAGRDRSVLRAADREFSRTVLGVRGAWAF
jgi:hypothetical protein